MISIGSYARRDMARGTAALVVAGMLGLTQVCAAATGYERFFGRFEGQAAMDDELELKPRDLRVEIGPTEDGFIVEWTALLRKADGRTKRIAYKVAFKPSRRGNIFRSAMRRNAFGHDVPLDPMKGEPYVWARIEGDVLTIYSMMITETGGYEMQVYDRKVVGDDMDLTYSRVRNGEVLRTLTGKLKRVK